MENECVRCDGTGYESDCISGSHNHKFIKYTCRVCGGTGVEKDDENK